MALAEDTNLRGRARLPVLVAIVLMALGATTASAQGMDEPGPGTPSQCSVFLLDRERYTTVDLPCPPNDVNSINNRGQITTTVVDSDGGFHGLIRDKRAGRARIDFPGAAGTAVFDINDRGEVVGVYSDTDPAASTAADRLGFLRDQRGRFTTIHVPGSVNTQAFGVNNRGQVVGDYLDRDGMTHGYLWDEGRFTTFDGPVGTGATFTNINDKGEIIGVYADPSDPGTLDGFLLSESVYTTFDAPDAPNTLPFGINNRGQIVGSTSAGPLTDIHGFLLHKGAKGRFTRIDFPGAPQTFAGGINDRGQIVGIYETPSATAGLQRSPMRMPGMMSGGDG
jgi:probable HAF family extracellular repeat protein